MSGKNDLARERRWPMVDGRWPKEALVAGEKISWCQATSVARHLFTKVEPNQREKHSQSEIFCFDLFLVGLLQCP
jgi:hypothetical protein